MRDLSIYRLVLLLVTILTLGVLEHSPLMPRPRFAAQVVVVTAAMLYLAHVARTLG